MTVRRRTWFSRNFSKHVLAERLRDYPLLRLLVFKKWFRVAVLAFVLLVGFLALFLPKIWTVTPRHFKPEIKISGLDVVQAWSLKRSARRAEAAGDREQADHAWLGAVINSPANPRLVRGFLRNALQREAAKVTLPVVIGQTFWLLRLAHTNEADLALAARVCERFHTDELTLGLLGPLEKRLDGELQKVFLKALFNAGLVVDEFAPRWKNKPGKWGSDPETRLYDAAYREGWGPLRGTAEAHLILEEGKRTPATRELANRLDLAVSTKLQDAERYRAALDRLKTWHVDTAMDNAGYWQLLLAIGEKDEAVRQAQQYPTPPRTAIETIRLGQAYNQLGLRDQARQLLQKYLAEFGYSEKLWQTYATLLIDDQQWEPLAALALKIRQESTVGNVLVGFSYYLEGRALLGQNRRPAAEMSFRKMLDYDYEDPGVGMFIAADLNQCGFYAISADFLKKFEQVYDQSPIYWDLVFESAFRLKQPERMLAAAAKAYSLRPRELKYMNNYAAALLIVRQQPDEAIKLTRQIMSAAPDLILAKINHSMALLMNRRTSEAAALVGPIAVERLNAEAANSYYMARYELELNQQQWQQARQTRARIDVKYLFPNQIKWLDDNKPPAQPKS